MFTIVQAETADHIRQVQTLFAEYFDYLRAEVDTTLDDLDDVPPLAGYREEMAGLPGKYAPPEGRLLLALADGEVAGCVAFYRFGDDTCELKRLWTRPQYRGRKIGRALVETAIREARRAGYAAIVLSTVSVMEGALALYRALGFQPTAPYFDGPPEVMAREVFLRLDLT